MCGIAGIFSKHNHVKQQLPYIDWCLKTMQHRGPDSNGIWLNEAENYVTSFVRLAIQDISPAGNQPMLSACGNYCISFNGEIYNAEPYKQQLINEGVNFKSTGDTEVLLYALIHWGKEKVLQEFDGMFAFAFYDVHKNTLLLARDRLGIKPLYIGFTNDSDIIYSSQYNHIINYKSIASEPIDASVAGTYLQLGYVPSSMGIIQNTMLLPHGSCMEINANEHSINQYYTVERNALPTSTKTLDQLITTAVQEQLISDVPLGTFLSSGVDSSLITVTANQLKKVTAFTAGTNDELTDETKDAAWLTKKLAIEHDIKHITEQDILVLLKQGIEAYTEPFADYSSLPSILVAEHAARKVKVVLSGDGPDELFWGYARTAGRMIKNAQQLSKSYLSIFCKYLLYKLGLSREIISLRMLRHKNFAAFYYVSVFISGAEIWLNKIFKATPAEPALLKKYKTLAINKYSADDVMDISWNIEMNFHLQRILIKMDRASMFKSIEVRVPYLNNAILELAQSINWQTCINNNQGKVNVKSLLAHHTGQDYVTKPKKGFIIPMGTWLKNELKQEVVTTFNTMPQEIEKLFNRTQLLKMLQLHFNGKQDSANVIWAVYSLCTWYNTHRNSYQKYLRENSHSSH